MSDNKPSETETILMALDQISQTIDVMTSVVNRLRNYVHQQNARGGETPSESSAEALADRVVH